MELDSMIGIDKLELSYEAHVAGFDGENFTYSIYFDNCFGEEKLEEVNNAVNEFIEPYADKDIYLGYLDITAEEDKVSIYHDLGGVEPDYNDTAIQGLLMALNHVTKIKSVIINEDSDFMF